MSVHQSAEIYQVLCLQVQVHVQVPKPQLQVQVPCFHSNYITFAIADVRKDRYFSYRTIMYYSQAEKCKLIYKIGCFELAIIWNKWM